MRTIENIHNTPEHTMSINIGMSEAQRKTIAEGLAKVLADSYTLYLKTHKFHWNCLLYTSPSPRDRTRSRMPSSA